MGQILDLLRAATGEGALSGALGRWRLTLSELVDENIAAVARLAAAVALGGTEVGSYVGDGTVGRAIDVGFRPKVLFIYSSTGVGGKLASMPGSVAFLNGGVGPGLITLTDTGVIIEAGATPFLNVLGVDYYTLANR